MTRITVFLLSILSLQLSAQVTKEKELSAYRRSANITGMQIVYQHGEKVEYFHDGNSETDPVKPVTDSTVFEAASLSKVVLAYTFMRLYDRGLFDLDKPLYDYFQYPRINKDSIGRTVTARMVLTHTSGFPNWTVNPGNKQWAKSSLNTKFQPGTNWSYSGEGFVFLQLVMENMIGKSLNEIAAKEVFEPLHMTRSSFIWQSWLEPLMAYGHSENGEQSQRNVAYSANGAASLITTATDYNLFLRALIKGQGLQPATAQLMFTKAVTPAWYGQPKKPATTHLGWGLGVGLEENARGKAIWHWGDNGDFKCFFIIFPANAESLIVFTNDERGMLPMDKILSLFFGKQNWWALEWLK